MHRDNISWPFGRLSERGDHPPAELSRSMVGLLDKRLAAADAGSLSAAFCYKCICWVRPRTHALVDVLAVVQREILQSQRCGQDAACGSATDEVKQIPDGPARTLLYLPQQAQRGNALHTACGHELSSTGLQVVRPC